MKKKKCSCGHTADYHYISDAEISKGQVFCHKDNCYGWQNCDMKASQIDTSKPTKH